MRQESYGLFFTPAVSCFPTLLPKCAHAHSLWRVENQDVAILLPTYRLGSGVNLPIGPLRRPVDLGECHQLQHVEGILPAFNILLHILNPTSLPPHAVQGSYEVILVELVLVSQQGTLLQGYRHRRPVFGTFTAGEPDPVQPSADRSSEPQYLHILPLLRHYILAQGSE